MRLAIVGGGITGLTFMNYMQKLKQNAVLYEKKPDFMEKGSGILLGINAMKIMRDLGLEEKVVERGQVLNTMSQADRNGATITRGDMRRISEETGYPTVCISRADLHTILEENVKDRPLATNLAVEDIFINEQAVLRLSNGAKSGFDFVVAADGIQSVIRNRINRQTGLRYSGYTCWRFVIPAPKNLEMDKAWEFVGKGKRFGVFPMGNNSVYCFATLNAKADFFRKNPVNKNEFRELYKEFKKIVPDCLNQLDEKEVNLIQRDIADLKSSFLTKAGYPVIITGDAGHATTPNMGQGAAMGMEDAYVFARLIETEKDPVLLAQKFAKARKKRVETIRRQSLWMGKLTQLENCFLASLRNRLLRIIPEQSAQNALKNLLLHESVFDS